MVNNLIMDIMAKEYVLIVTGLRCNSKLMHCASWTCDELKQLTRDGTEQPSCIRSLSWTYDVYNKQLSCIGSLSWTCDQLNKYRAFDYYHEPVINRTSIVHRIAIMNLRCVEQIWCIGSLMNFSCMNKYHGSCNYHELEMHWTRWHWEVSFIESLITRHLNVGNCDAYERNVNIIENHYVFN